MKEDKVHLLSQHFLLDNGYSYKGVCNNTKFRKNRVTGKDELLGGEIRVPIISDYAIVKIDHMGEKGIERLWIEDKGSCNTSTILEGFSRICFAVFYGSGDGLLALPHDMIKKIKEIDEFLILLAHIVIGRGRVGILDVEQKKYWFY